MSMSLEERQEIMDAGLHNDTYFDKLKVREARRIGWKIWGVDDQTSEPEIIDKGFDSKGSAVAFIKEHGQLGVWFVKEASPEDYDYYHDGEKQYYFHGDEYRDEDAPYRGGHDDDDDDEDSDENIGFRGNMEEEEEGDAERSTVAEAEERNQRTYEGSTHRDYYGVE